MSTTYNTLEFERDGHVGWLRMNRPDKLNSFTIEMWREMRAFGMEMRDDADLRALVVIGNGRAFSSGIDTSVFTGGGADSIEEGDDKGSRHADPTVDGILRTQEAYSWLADARYPTIAAVRGYALGAGLQIALACDIRVFARGTQVGLLEHKYGILPDLGGTQRLPRVVGAGKAKELIWTAARIDAEEAHRIGLCERLVDEPDLEKEVDALARGDRGATAACRAGREACRRCCGTGAGRRGADRRGAGAGVVPALGRHARGDHRVRRATRSRLLRHLGCSSMTQFRVRANGPLEGVVQVSGATKNSGLKQMAAALLVPGVTQLRNMPAVRDLEVMIELLHAIGAHGRTRRRTTSSASTRRLTSRPRRPTSS